MLTLAAAPPLVVGSRTAATAADPTVGAWSVAESMERGRSGHTATLLQDGTVLVAGGGGDTSAEVYDPVPGDAGQWSSTGPMTTSRSYHTATLLPDGTVLVVGGCVSDDCGGANKALASAEVYHPGTRQWTATAAMSTARYRHTATLLPNGTALVVGGCRYQGSCNVRENTPNDSAMATAEIFDPSKGTWTTTSPLGMGRGVHTATLLKGPFSACGVNCGKVLVTGGHASAQACITGAQLTQATATAELYDAATGRWEPAGTMALPRAFHTATRLPDGKVLAAGGVEDGGWEGEANGFQFDCVASTGDHLDVSKTSEIFDPLTGVWTRAGDLKIGRHNHTASVLDGEVCDVTPRPDFCGDVAVQGGRTRDVTFPPGDRADNPAATTAELFDLATRAWRATGSLVTPRLGRLGFTRRPTNHSAVTLRSGRVLVAGGREPSTQNAVAGAPITAAELFDPVAQLQPPSVTRLAPPTGMPEGGIEVTIRGAAFTSVTAVRFGAIAASSYEVVSSSEITAVVPPNAAGPVYVTVTTNDSSAGARTSARIGDAIFTYAGPAVPPPPAAPSATGISPPAGTTFGGTTVTINGVGLSGQNLTVSFDGVAAASVIVDSDSQLRAVTPPHPQGLATVGITTSAGKAQVSYRYAAGDWGPAPVLERERFLHTATLLPDGQVLVAGGKPGFCVTGEPVSTCHLLGSELYDPASGQWAAKAAMSVFRYGHTATLLDGPACRQANKPAYCGKVLAVGGQDPNVNAPVGVIELYDAEANRWEPAGSLGLARFGHTATLLDGPECRGPQPAPSHCGKILVAGGSVTPDVPRHTLLAATELYDPLTRVATPGGLLVQIREYHTATLLPNGHVLVAGGVTPVISVEEARNRPLLDVLTPTQTTEVYDPSSNRWRRAGNLGVARLMHTATLLDRGQCGASCGKVLVTGGVTGTSGFDVVASGAAEMFNPADGTWRAEASGRPRAGHTATVLPDGKILLAGGGKTLDFLSNLPPEQSVQLFDPSAPPLERWSDGRPLSQPKGGHTATLLDVTSCNASPPSSLCGTVLVTGGGQMGAAAVPTSEIYTPAPVVTAVAPDDGSPSWPTPVEITGYGFNEDSGVRVGGVPASATVVESPNRIRAVAPPGMGTVEVAVTNAGGTSSSVSPRRGSLFTYLGRPGAVEGLEAAVLSPTRIALTFLAPSDGGTRKATSFVVKQSTSQITDENFDAAMSLCGGVCDTRPTERFVIEVDDLQPATTYFYAVRARNRLGLLGPMASVSASTQSLKAAVSPCPTVGGEAPAPLALTGGRYYLVGVPGGTVVGGDTPLYGWFDLGAGGSYVAKDQRQPTAPGRGYWSWSRCNRLVMLGAGPSASVKFPLGAYRASMVGNPSGTGPAAVSGHDFAARWEPEANAGAGGYRLSGHREAQLLAVGEGLWVFSYTDTTIAIAAGT